MTDPTAQRAAEVMCIAHSDAILHGFGSETLENTLLDALTAAGIGLYDKRTHVAVPREPTDAIGKASAMTFECKCGRRITQYAVNKWPVMLAAHEEFTDE